MLKYYWKFFKMFMEKYGRPPYGDELNNIKNLAKQQEEAEKVIDIAPRLPKDAPYSDKNPGGWMEGGLESLKDKVDDLIEKGKEYKETTVGDFIADYFDMPKKPKTRPGKINYEEMQSKFPDVKLYGDESFDELLEIEKTGIHPRDKKAGGGRIGYGYGTGLKLYRLLKKEGLTIKKAIQEAKERFTNFSGDLKYDADALLDDILDTYGIDRDAVDQYDIIDAYDKVYKDLSKSKYQNMYNIAAQRAMSGQDEIMELQAKYPGLTDELAEKIANDPDPQRKAEAISTFEQAQAMRQKGMDSDQIISTLEKGRKTRRDNAGGGLNYLMGL